MCEVTSSASTLALAKRLGEFIATKLARFRVIDYEMHLHLKKMQSHFLHIIQRWMQGSKMPCEPKTNNYLE